jgi:hypothetical protein
MLVDKKFETILEGVIKKTQMPMLSAKIKNLEKYLPNFLKFLPENVGKSEKGGIFLEISFVRLNQKT